MFNLLSTVVSRTVMSLRFYPTDESACHPFSNETPRSDTKVFSAHITVDNRWPEFYDYACTPPTSPWQQCKLA